MTRRGGTEHMVWCSVFLTKRKSEIRFERMLNVNQKSSLVCRHKATRCHWHPHTPKISSDFYEIPEMNNKFIFGLFRHPHLPHSIYSRCLLCIVVHDQKYRIYNEPLMPDYDLWPFDSSTISAFVWHMQCTRIVLTSKCAMEWFGDDARVFAALNSHQSVSIA